MNDLKNEIVKTSGLLVALCNRLAEQLAEVEPPGGKSDGPVLQAVLNVAQFEQGANAFAKRLDELLTRRVNIATARARALAKLTEEDRIALHL